MNVQEALATCEATVRRVDPDRYFATLFAPSAKRPLLNALYAFNHEIGHAVEVTREPVMAEIRLQWWREAIESAALGRPPAHPAAIGLAEIFARTSPPMDSFKRLIDAQALDASDAQIRDVEEVERYFGQRTAELMQIAASLLNGTPATSEIILEAGLAYGLARFLQAVPTLQGRGMIAGHDPAAARLLIAAVSNAARAHLACAREIPVPEGLLAVVLPAALVPAYLSAARRLSDSLRERVEIAPLRRQLVLLRAALLGRL